MEERDNFVYMSAHFKSQKPEQSILRVTINLKGHVRADYRRILTYVHSHYQLGFLLKGTQKTLRGACRRDLRSEMRPFQVTSPYEQSGADQAKGMQRHTLHATDGHLSCEAFGLHARSAQIGDIGKHSRSQQDEWIAAGIELATLCMPSCRPLPSIARIAIEFLRSFWDTGNGCPRHLRCEGRGFKPQEMNVDISASQ
ncbi:hypothetical protein CAPTEDRAFT_208214 [Capitella teleta]|uniref:Uncharacterized protein n=1 Tax=Capitella teleta TaxID=283909 RepID=R7T5Q1_CAPTE|nr:hypothetical protein CAPTEDRAFT_208214 [Capitella teleta]|eukprot:ELT88503.1 hypothetical protein CAPTEDRAFT_208214 [Capitella teleta]